MLVFRVKTDRHKTTDVRYMECGVVCVCERATSLLTLNLSPLKTRHDVYVFVCAGVVLCYLRTIPDRPAVNRT